MFKKFLNLFKKQPKVDDDNKYAAITYTLDDDNMVNVDINVHSYDSESIHKLAILLNTATSVSSLMTTIEMIKQNLKEQGEEDLLLEFIVLITTLVQSTHEDNTKKKPCVSPSEMI